MRDIWSIVASAAVAGVSVLGGLLVARLEFRRVVMKEFLAMRWKAFQDYEAVFSRLLQSRCFGEFYQVTNCLASLCGDSVREVVTKVQTIVRELELSGFDIDVEQMQLAHLELLFAMHEELQTYPKVKIRRKN